MSTTGYRQNESVNRLLLQAEQGAINFDTSTVSGDGISGTLAAVLAEHNLTPQDVWGEEPPFGTFAEGSFIIDQAPRAVYLLMHVFPKLEKVEVWRKVSSRDGGGEYPWKRYRIERLPEGSTNKWRFHPTSL